MLGVLLVTLLWTLVGVAHPATAEAADPKGVLEIVTVPKVLGHASWWMVEFTERTVGGWSDSR